MSLVTDLNTASSRGLYINSGNGPTFQPFDIGHDSYIALISPDTAFWSLVRKDNLAEVLTNSELMAQYRQKAADFAEEMQMLRFGLKPSAVYFNPTERCNLNCTYCYVPENMRSNGRQMTTEEVLRALELLKTYFKQVLPEGTLPQVIFHSSEPMLSREAVFTGIERYANDFHFGVQTNGTLLDRSAIEFLTANGVGIGLSLDGHIASVADRTRYNWTGAGAFDKVLTAMEALKDYPAYNVICTVTNQNMQELSHIVDFFHQHQVPVCMLNPVRCTRQGARGIKPTDHELSEFYFKALDRSYELYQQTGRKLVVANFANVLASIIAPTGRKLMCDISPCGGGRCFFALAASGDLFPCSEFVGLEEFNGGNIFRDDISAALASQAFSKVSGRLVEEIEPCRRCAVRHFCGSPCPAEAYEMNGGMNRTGAFCELYEEQVRYALRLIADGKESAFLWDSWDKETTTTFETKIQ